VKILMLSPSYAPQIGGVERHVEALSRALVSCGDRVTILSRACSADVPGEERNQGVHVLRVPTGSGGAPPSNAGIRRWLRAHRAILRDVDVIHAHDYVTFVSWLLPVAPWSVRARAYVTFHGYERYPIQRRDLILRRIASRLARRSLAVGSFIDRWFGTRSSAVIHGGVDPLTAEETDRWRAADPRPHEVAFLGRLAEDTGISTLVAGLSLVPEDRRPPLVVIGDGPERAAAEALARERGLTCAFLGWIADPWARIRPGSLVVATGYLSILESWIRSLRVLVPYDNPLRLDYYRSLPHSEGGLIAVDSPSRLYLEIASLLDAPWPERRLPEAVRLWASGQTWEAMAAAYRRLWRS
jgi:glycosyltransferase involved in cell wall biosynthesis